MLITLILYVPKNVYHISWVCFGFIGLVQSKQTQSKNTFLQYLYNHFNKNHQIKRLSLFNLLPAARLRFLTMGLSLLIVDEEQLSMWRSGFGIYYPLHYRIGVIILFWYIFSFLTSALPVIKMTMMWRVWLNAYGYFRSILSWDALMEENIDEKDVTCKCNQKKQFANNIMITPLQPE